jgi:hypothetical protein
VLSTLKAAFAGTMGSVCVAFRTIVVEGKATALRPLKSNHIISKTVNRKVPREKSMFPYERTTFAKMAACSKDSRRGLVVDRATSGGSETHLGRV